MKRITITYDYYDEDTEYYLLDCEYEVEIEDHEDTEENIQRLKAILENGGQV